MNFLMIEFNDGKKTYINANEIYKFFVDKHFLTIEYYDQKLNNENAVFMKENYKSWELI